MAVEKETYRILVVSSSEKMADVIRDVMSGPQYRDITCVSTMGDAKRTLVSHLCDILIINTPLKDDYGIQSAIDVAEQHTIGILLMVKAEMYEQVLTQTEDYGIVVLTKPTTRQNLYTSIKMLSAMRMKMRRMEAKLRRMEEKMQEQKTIDRAKWILVDQRKMSEPDAHRYIEKAAMDRCVKKIRIAEEVIRDAF